MPTSKSRILTKRTKGCAKARCCMGSRCTATSLRICGRSCPRIAYRNCPCNQFAHVRRGCHNWQGQRLCLYERRRDWGRASKNLSQDFPFSSFVGCWDGRAPGHRCSESGRFCCQESAACSVLHSTQHHHARGCWASDGLGPKRGLCGSLLVWLSLMCAQLVTTGDRPPLATSLLPVTPCLPRTSLRGCPMASVLCCACAKDVKDLYCDSSGNCLPVAQTALRQATLTVDASMPAFPCMRMAL